MFDSGVHVDNEKVKRVIILLNQNKTKNEKSIRFLFGAVVFHSINILTFDNINDIKNLRQFFSL